MPRAVPHVEACAGPRGYSGKGCLIRGGCGAQEGPRQQARGSPWEGCSRQRGGRCKGPEVGRGLACSEQSREASGAAGKARATLREAAGPGVCPRGHGQIRVSSRAEWSAVEAFEQGHVV